MNIVIQGSSFEVTDALTQSIHEHFAKLEKLIQNQDVEFIVTLYKTKHQYTAKSRCVAYGHTTVSDSTNDDMYVSISKLAHSVNIQLLKLKNRSQRIDKLKELNWDLPEDNA